MSASDQQNGSQASKASDAPGLMAYRCAQIAATLMAQRLQHFQKAGLPRDLSDPMWDLEFEGAIKRAEMMIRSALKRDHHIHAYQVFREGDLFTAEGIAKKFKSVGWKGLSSKIPVENLLNSLRKEMEEHFENTGPEGNPNVAPAVRRFMGIITWLRKDPHLVRICPHLKEAVDDFIAKAIADGENGGALMQSGEYYYESISNAKFMEWCFPVEASGSNQIRRYRPHEIFRFACQHEWSSNELIQLLSKLESDFVPDPAKGGGLSRFSVFDGQFSLYPSDLVNNK